MSERLDRVLETLRLEQVDPDTFTGHNMPMPHGRVFGGQVLAQALLAAAATVPHDRVPHSVHGYFLRPGDITTPITFAIERLRDGRSFTARRTHALQDGQPLLSMITSFQLDQDGLEHTSTAPDVPDPESLPMSLDVLAPLDHPMATFWGRYGAFDVRHVEQELYLSPDPTRTDLQHVWMRSRGPLPDDPVLHRALLAFACDQVMLEPVLRRHGASWASRDLSVASLDHAMWWHRPARADEWLLYVQSSPSAQGGRGLGSASVYDRAGALVATIAQEGMVRLP
ncbi:acyl-CoA thioesterase II [Actinotalea sp. M2MS4P-6]|uniref:acyl-CoA thioesterase n=1 Tax=Actinotalea sp. M2MS4P-6 TaxID=2983762 RepID=UPI0021E45792|nr:acyl-CoA thioesterase II [Actinotalea sp. M2MS4P-6]MCV2396213.1 acyl-CoA thioesterase II [Actinotalea sp. M2MS4P-6]